MFIAGLVVTSVIGRAQAQQKSYRIAMVSPSEPVSNMTIEYPVWGAFFKELRQLGYIEGQNLSVERFSGKGRTEHFSELVENVVRGNPDLIFTTGDRLTRAIEAASGTIPIVAIVGDPVVAGFASTLARPAGSITGVTSDAGGPFRGKHLELLHEMVPAASTVGWIASPRIRELQAAVMQDAAERLRLSLVGPPLNAPFEEAEYARVFAAMAREGANAMVVADQPENNKNRQLIVELAEKYRLPAIYYFRMFPEAGGLISYGVDLIDLFRHMADAVDQIFKGAKPGEIPFYQPTKFELVVNLKAAKALGIEVPGSLLARADEVIE
jgi:putative ABC transport system substrate-binding protein